jgi:hypothetical protein
MMTEPLVAKNVRGECPQRWWGMLNWLLEDEGVEEVVETRVHFDASPETVWSEVMFFEEVEAAPPLLLRAVMPYPVRTDGGKAKAGAEVHCIYEGGEMTKRMTRTEAPRLIEFEVLEQRLGIESCVVALGGSYVMTAQGGGTDVVLTTRYRACLRPRFFWRVVERVVAGQLHSHVLNGMLAAVRERAVVVVA